MCVTVCGVVCVCVCVCVVYSVCVYCVGVCMCGCNVYVCVCVCMCICMCAFMNAWVSTLLFGTQPAEPTEIKLGAKTPCKMRALCGYKRHGQHHFLTNFQGLSRPEKGPSNSKFIDFQTLSRTVQTLPDSEIHSDITAICISLFTHTNITKQAVYRVYFSNFKVPPHPHKKQHQPCFTVRKQQ